MPKSFIRGKPNAADITLVNFVTHPSRRVNPKRRIINVATSYQSATLHAIAITSSPKRAITMSMELRCPEDSRKLRLTNG